VYAYLITHDLLFHVLFEENYYIFIHIGGTDFRFRKFRSKI